MTGDREPWRSLPFAPLCTLAGTVMHGKQLGRRLGFPTLNLRYREADGLPENGVYAALCWLLPGTGDPLAPPYLAVLNQGRHPTFPEGPPTVEAHLLDFAGDAYGREAVLCYGRYLRPEMRFPTGEALAAQLGRDCEAARRWADALTPNVF